MKKIISIQSITFGVIISILGILIAFSLFVRPTLNSVHIQGGDSAAWTTHQVIQFNLTHALQSKQDVKSITFSEDIKFLYAISDDGKTISITPDILKHQTKYTIEIQLANAQPIITTFTTESERFLYVKTSKDPAVENELVLTEASGNFSESLFKAKKISQYCATKEYAVVTTQNGDGTQDAWYVDRKSKISRILNMGNVSVFRLDCNPTKHEFVYTYYKMEKENDQFAQSAQSFMNIFDLNSGTNRVLNPKNTANSPLEVRYAPDGSSILYQGNDSVFYLVSTTSLETIQSIGRYSSVSAFSSRAELVFTSLFSESFVPALYLTSTNGTVTPITDLNGQSIDPDFSSDGKQIYYATDTGASAHGSVLFGIARWEATKRQVLLQSKNMSYELPHVNSTNSKLLIEEYPSADLDNTEAIRFFGVRGRPSVGTIRIFDIQTNKLLEKHLEGFMAQWDE